ncbi:ABC transporter substrate-binding protein [Rhodococcus triatomae BKS 15-14]|nr:ABC transporter substrate-binding protein [Rhodococcus triatomae BKS 15-14]
MTAVAVGLTTATALALTGCSSASDAATDGRVTVVASTNVWGSVAAAVAGEYADVTSIINEPSADPHSYEASPRDAAAVTDADLVVYNGGGYDEFVEDILAAEGDKPTVNAYELLGTESDLHAGHDHEPTATGTDAIAEDAAAHDTAESHDSHAGHSHSHGGVNEHVWYDISTVDTVAHAIATELGELDPANAAAYTANAESFHGKLHTVADITADVAARHAHTPVAQTEPTAHYLLAAADLDDRTPEDFTRAIEEGNDPPPAAIAATRDLLSGKQVAVLVYNNQTEDKVTRDMRSVAEAAGVPVVEVTETLPEGVDYVQWQLSIAEQLAAALEGAAAGTSE